MSLDAWPIPSVVCVCLAASVAAKPVAVIVAVLAVANHCIAIFADACLVPAYKAVFVVGDRVSDLCQHGVGVLVFLP